MPEYKLLEPSSFSSLGITKGATFDGGSDTSFFSTSSFVYTLFFVAIIAAAFYEYILVGVYRMEASESGIRRSNETFKRTTLGLLGVFGLFLLIFTINKGLLTGDVGLTELRAKPGVAGGGGELINTSSPLSGGSSSGGSSKACDTNDSVKAKIASGNICSGTVCKSLSGCKWATYKDLIKSESAAQGVDPKLIVVTMCKESGGNPAAKNQNPNNTWDCGIMQINQPGACDPNPTQAAIIDNIKKGISLMKGKINATNQVYPGVPREAGYFSTYNCCADGTSPNSKSVSCGNEPGFPSVPKWACPIDPGTGPNNMCTVRNYACELNECLKQLPDF